jgi:glucose uptake protein GlcU
MDFEQVFMFWLLLVLASTIGGIILLVQGIRRKNPKRLFIGIALLCFGTLLVWLAIYLAANFRKVGG